MEIFEKKNKNKIWSKYTLKRTKLHHLKKFLGGACPRTPLTMRMASPCAACRFATCKFPNLKKKNSWPPPFQILGTPLSVYEKLQATRAKVAPVNLIYGSHFSATEATYKVSQNMGNFVEFTRTFTRIIHKPDPV